MIWGSHIFRQSHTPWTRPIVEFGILGHLRIWRLANWDTFFWFFIQLDSFSKLLNNVQAHMILLSMSFNVVTCDSSNRIPTGLGHVYLSRKGFLAQPCRLSQWSWKLSKVLRRNCFGSETWLTIHHLDLDFLGPEPSKSKGVSKMNSLFFGLMKGRTHSAAGVDVLFQCESWAVEWLVACTVSKR